MKEIKALCVVSLKLLRNGLEAGAELIVGTLTW